MTFPQSFDGNKKLSVNILFLPRNQNPFSAAMEVLPDTPAFINANIFFQAKILSGTEKFPNTLNFTRADNITTAAPKNKIKLFNILADVKHFNIENLGQSNADLDLNKDQANKTKTLGRSIKKYLPVTYRQSFNFIAPVMPNNAVTDDSYHCAVRDAKFVPGFKQTADAISWGKVFAYILRNRLLAREAGFIYNTEVEINVDEFEDGGWIYIDLADESDYKKEQNADDAFIKKYAARIPSLKAGIKRPLFAANQFPVLHKKPADLTDPAPEGNFDNIFIEAAEYDDGFAKILHAFQPVSQNILLEQSDGFHPTIESGIRLGWDDEQILTWYVRQMAEDTSIGAGKRIDAPIGVFGYHIDVKEKEAAGWKSLNYVQTRPGINPLGDVLSVDEHEHAEFEGELPYQVYPSQLDGDESKSFWLPMYFANWNGHSMVLPDKDAIRIYQHGEDVNVDFDAADPEKKGNTNVTGSPKNELLKIYEPLRLNTKLKYGGLYDFRVRMTDMTHGGPLPEQDPFNDATTPIGNCHFKRYVAPSAIRIADVPFNDDGAVYDKPSLNIQRPLLGYPAVVYCDKYTDPVTRLINKLKKELDDAKADPINNSRQLESVGLADPDVESVEISVEVQALKMDYQLSMSGKESFSLLYKTLRKFATPNNDNDYEDKLNIPVKFVAANVLKFGDTADLGDLGFDQTALDALDEIILPKARAIRLTVRAVCKEQPDYYGLEKENPAFNTRYGRTSFINLYKESDVEKDLFATNLIQAIYLQPDDIALTKNIIPHKQHINAQPVNVPDSVQRLAHQLKIVNNGLSLVGNNGQRIQFGCSARIRHTLAPDNSALTFASKADLYHHWLCCINLDIKRDWTWDALQDTSFLIKRVISFKETPAIVKEQIVGEIELKHSISFTALQNADRTFTTLVFIDALEPKKELGIDTNIFPDILEVTYTVIPQFKKDHGATNDGNHSFETLQLPVTINPTQIPKIASAGIALSPYRRNEKYSSSEARRRFLWIEFEEAVHDPNDLYFARILAYAPDQLISNNNHYLEKKVTEPPLNIDPEYIRVIVPGSSDDHAGINAMQPMEKSLMSDKHYLVPLPPGLNESSPELFGFFTYEFRVGHSKIWSTARGRYGRPLKATGIQHPAPTLTCAVNRDEQKLYVTAPYATAVFNGKNVTANPPHTELWCLLYAQVKQADNNDADKALKDYRNILLDDRIMHWGFKLRHDVTVDDIDEADDDAFGRPLIGLHQVTKKWMLAKMNIHETYSKFIKIAPVKDLEEQNADAAKYGTTFWTNKEVNELLTAYGLPPDLPLSVLCVEIFTNITSEQQYRTRTVRQAHFNHDNVNIHADNANVINPALAAVANRKKPLSDALGNFRILRTSPLCEVPYICCTE
jgi:hypothetical protein